MYVANGCCCAEGRKEVVLLATHQFALQNIYNKLGRTFVGLEG